jgi:hypothetical protein
MDPAFVCLLDTRQLTVHHDVVNDWLYSQWKGRHNAETVPVCAAHVFACLEVTKCQKLLSDHTELTGDWQAVAMRVGSEALAQTAARGVRAIAWVYGPDYHDQLAMHLAVSVATRPVIAIFDDVASACQWLQHTP